MTVVVLAQKDIKYEVEVQWLNGVKDKWINMWELIKLIGVRFRLVRIITTPTRKERVNVVLHDTEIITWEYHGFGQDSLGLCQGTVIKGLSINVKTMSSFINIVYWLYPPFTPCTLLNTLSWAKK